MTYFRFYPDCHYYPGPVKGTIYDISRNQIIWVKPHETYIINKFLKTTIESVIEEIGPDAKEVLDKLVNQGFGCVHNANVFTEKLYSKSNLNLGNLTMGHLNLQTVYLQLSDKCDRSCSFCPKASQYNWQGCNSCLKWPSNRLNTEIELPEFLPTLHEIICYKPKKLVFSGGNPLMVWEKLIQIIKIVRSQISNVSIQVNTNGVGLTNEMISDAAKWNLSFCFTIFQDYLEDTSIFSRNIKGCIYNDVDYTMALILTSDNTMIYEELLRYVKQFNSPKIYTTELISKESIRSIISLPTDENRIHGVNSTKYFLHHSVHPCLERSIAISSAGNILPCPMSEDIIGNVFTNKNLRYTLKNDLFDKYWFNTKEDIPICKDCEYRWACEDCAILEHATINDNEVHKAYCKYVPDQGLWAE